MLNRFPLNKIDYSGGFHVTFHFLSGLSETSGTGNHFEEEYRTMTVSFLRSLRIPMTITYPFTKHARSPVTTSGELTPKIPLYEKKYARNHNSLGSEGGRQKRRPGRRIPCTTNLRVAKPTNIFWQTFGLPDLNLHKARSTILVSIAL